MEKGVAKKIQIEIIKNQNLTKKQKEIINKARVKLWGKENKKDFSKDYEPKTLWFFVKDKDKIVSFGGIRPIKTKYNKKEYSIGGICSTISLEKGKGYGTILMNAMENYSKKTGKTLLGFTTQTKFFKKAGTRTKKDLIKRFIFLKKNGEKIYDNEGDGIYYDGKDRLISKIIKTKSPAYIFVEHW